jgi:hypothetical protein
MAHDGSTAADDQTDEQAPLPATLQKIVRRVATGLENGSDFVYVHPDTVKRGGLTSRFNCQMGRGRTTTGMIVASLIATIRMDDMKAESAEDLLDESYDDDGHSTDSEQYLAGEYC